MNSADSVPTSAQRVGRLLLDEPLAGAKNMAIDEALLEAVADGRSGVALRYYQWNEPTLSLGYFQHVAERAAHVESRDCTLVRRSSGGGAILHHHELTYSLIVPSTSELAADALTLYHTVHGALIEALGEFGIMATLCDGPVPSARRRAEEPFLCFARRAAGDLLCNGEKICGSAQRRRRGAILQHGSVLLARSASAPQLPGLAEVSGREVLPGELTAAWLRRLQATWQLDFVPSRLSSEEAAAAEQLQAGRFADQAWTERK